MSDSPAISGPKIINDAQKALPIAIRRQLLQAATEKFPDRSDYWERLGVLQFYLNEVAQAADTFERAFEIDPVGFTAFTQFVKACKALSDPTRALTLCRRALAAGRDTARLHAAVGEICTITGDTAAALAAWRCAAQRSPTACWAAERCLEPAAWRGDGEALLEAIAGLPAPHDQGTTARAYRAIALGLIGQREAARAEVDFDNLVREVELSCPAGFDSLESFNDALRDEIAARPDVELAQDGNWRRVANMDMHGAYSVLAKLAAGHLHAFRDAWAVRTGDAPCFPDDHVLAGTGRMLIGAAVDAPHFHNHSFMSAIYYVSVPSGLAGEQGHLALGDCGRAAGPEGPIWDIRYVQPKAGKLVLFPSHVFHAVRATGSCEARVAVAFDIFPAGLDQL